MKCVFCFIVFAATAAGILLPAAGYPSFPENDPGGLELLFYAKNTPTEFIVVEKKYQRLSVFEQKDQVVRLVREFVCATGQNPGTKQAIGDSRTPEGFYFITEIYEDKQVTVFGSRAFHLGYPNIFDIHAGHLGDGIFIHGTNKALIPYSTNGCIALSNPDLDELAPYLAVNTIPIIILDALPEPLAGRSLTLQPDMPRFAEILRVLSFDLAKVPVQDIQSLSFLKQGEKAVVTVKYATYERDRLQYREQLRTYLTRSPVDTWRNVLSVQSQEKNPYLIARYPLKNDLVTRLAAPAAPPGAVEPIEPEPAKPLQPPGSTQALAAAAAQAADPTAAAVPVTAVESVPPKKPAPPAEAVHSPPVPAVPPKPVIAVVKTEPETPKQAIPPRQPVPETAAKPPAIARSQPKKRESLLKFVEKWRSAWVSKDIESYISCYSPSFTSDGLDREGWKRKKLSLNKRYAFIKVSISNIVVKWTPTGADVSFFQTYRSDRFEATGTKVLHLSGKDSRWLIERETM